MRLPTEAQTGHRKLGLERCLDGKERVCKMGANQNNPRERKSRRKDTTGKSVLDALGTTQHTGAQSSWRDVGFDTVLALLLAVTEKGGAVQFGKSRDGAALSITLYYDGDRRTVWIGPDDDPYEKIEKILTVFESIA